MTSSKSPPTNVVPPETLASSLYVEDAPSVMKHPLEQPQGVDGNPKFGRLLIVLVAVVLLLGLLTWFMEFLYE